jgi:hypothetical protein
LCPRRAITTSCVCNERAKLPKSSSSRTQHAAAGSSARTIGGRGAFAVPAPVDCRLIRSCTAEPHATLARLVRLRRGRTRLCLPRPVVRFFEKGYAGGSGRTSAASAIVPTAAAMSGSTSASSPPQAPQTTRGSGNGAPRPEPVAREGAWEGERRTGDDGCRRRDPACAWSQSPWTKRARDGGGER